jgi:uncharacterized protein YidB (DUF937 family)
MAFDDAVTALVEKVGGSKQIVGSVSRLVHSEGLQGLVDKFTKAGHETKARSWVSTGANEPLSRDEVVQTLGDEKVAELAKEAGISHDEAANQLAVAIPKVVDELTPEGKVPEGDVFDQLLGKLKSLI